MRNCKYPNWLSEWAAEEKFGYTYQNAGIAKLRFASYSEKDDSDTSVSSTANT